MQLLTSNAYVTESLRVGGGGGGGGGRERVPMEQ